MRIYYYNYLEKKNPDDKNKSLVHLNGSISHLKYSANESTPRKPPIIMHWTDADNAMGVIKTLFQERKSMKEGIIGVDYVVTEPLLHPDYPERAARSYSVKFSRSEVATTWFHIPDKFKKTMAEQDRKYNKAINIEIVGWRFLADNNGRRNDTSKSGKKGIRENFNDDYEVLDREGITYPTVLKLVNYLAEKYDFCNLVDDFSPEKEIDPTLKDKGITYLNGPLSQYLKGHGLVALEHTLMFGGDYVRERHDFNPSDLLVLYSDLKNYRFYKQNSGDMLAKSIESKINSNVAMNQFEISDLKKDINKVKSVAKKEYLLYALYLRDEKVESIDKINAIKANLTYLNNSDREKITSALLTKFIDSSKDIKPNEYEYLSDMIGSVRDNLIKDRLKQTLVERYASRSKLKGS